MREIFRDDEIAHEIDNNEIALESVIELNPMLITDKITGHVFLHFEKEGEEDVSW